MRTSEESPRSLRVYRDDELQVVLKEDDPFADDTCFGSTVVLDDSALVRRSVELGKDDKTFVTLKLTPLSR